MSIAPATEELLRVNEVALRLKISESSVRLLIERDPSFPRPITLCPGRRRKLRIRASDLAAYIEKLG